MRYTNKRLLADNKFKIGFEFEFVAHELQGVLSNQYRKLRVPELFLHELDTCFHVSAQDHKDIVNILTYSGYNTDKFDYFSVPDDLVEYGPDRMIAALGLMPIKPLYRKVGNRYKDVTDEIKDKMTSFDLSDVKDLVRMIRSLRKCYVDAPVLGNYTSLTTEGEQEAYDAMIRVFKDFTGITLKRVESYDIVTKKNPAWFLTEEYVDDIKEGRIEYGFEVITPPLHPVEALEALRTVMDFLSSDELPFKIRTGVDCGVHINISHEDKTYEEVNQTFYGLMFDEEPVIKSFGRSKQHMCAAIRPIITKEIKRLTREKAITLLSLNDPATTQRVLDIIDSFSEAGGLKSARFTSMEKWGYVEYRMPGGRKYETKYNEIAALTIDLLRFTMAYQTDYTKHKVFIGKIRDIMESTGAEESTRKSIIEALPEFLTKFPKPKRPKRIDSDELLKIRDV